jgi:hypothetical protein
LIVSAPLMFMNCIFFLFPQKSLEFGAAFHNLQATLFKGYDGQQGESIHHDFHEISKSKTEIIWAVI